MTWKDEHHKKADNHIIRNIHFFSDLSPEETKDVEQHIIKKIFSKDQIVLSEEETSTYMYLVYSGKVRVVKISDDGREQIITIHKKGDFFGEMSLLDGKTAPATIIAHEDAMIGLLHKIDFEQHLLSHEGIRRKIIDLLCLRLRDAWMMVKILSFDSAEDRVIVALDQLKGLYGVRDDRGVIINIKVTHQLIASYASVARETATRILNKLEKTGEIVTLENKSFLLKDAFFCKIRAMSDIVRLDTV